MLEARNIEKSFGRGSASVKAINGISISIENGIFYSIIGKSGSGKTTLLRLLSGLLKPDSGEILYDGLSMTDWDEGERQSFRRKKIGLVFQDFKLFPELSVKENILLPMLLDGRTADESRCNKLMTALEIENLAEKRADEVSGGEAQRCAIARALINNPEVIFADEPTGNLDRKSSEKVLELLLRIHGSFSTSIVMVTHDLDMARCADRIIKLEDGRILKRGVTSFDS